MTRNQRLSFLGIAAVIAVVAIVVLTAGGGSDETGEDSANTSAQQTSTPAPSAGQEEDGTPTATPTATPTPKPQPPLLRAGKVTELRFTEGETIRFRARSAQAEEIHVHGYDRYVDLPAGKTVTESFKASITGIFEIELHGSAEQIGELTVDPK